jgi:hypothetical protein
MKTFNDKINKTYTLYLLENGGPIISHFSKDIARKKFKRALDLSMFVKSVLNMKRTKQKAVS